jgi:plasmid stabilization system protein ParE
MAMQHVEFLAQATEEASEARLWYAARSSDAAAGFIEELHRGVARIEESPQRWPNYLHGTRRYRLHRFPFLLVYRIMTDRIEVVACQHAHRRPGYWRGR